MLGINPPKLLAGAFDFEMTIPSVGEFWPVERKACFHKLRSNVASVIKIACGDQPVVAGIRMQMRRNRAPFAHLHHRPLGILAKRMVQFGRIDSCDTDGLVLNSDRVAIDDLARAGQDGRFDNLDGLDNRHAAGNLRPGPFDPSIKARIDIGGSPDFPAKRSEQEAEKSHGRFFSCGLQC